MKAAETGTPFTLFGTDHPTSDGTAVRDYVYVMDLAEAHIRAIDVIQSQERLVSNVGKGEGTSVRELLAAVESALQKKLNVQEEPIRPGDPPELVADAQYLRTWFSHEFKTVPEVVQDLVRLAKARTVS